MIVGFYVLLSNIHAINQRWADVTRIRRLMMKRGIEKTPGSSVIEVDDQIFLEEHLEQPFLNMIKLLWRLRISVFSNDCTSLRLRRFLLVSSTPQNAMSGWI
ncbi:hypothetical protein NC653_035463 [Populus alba x Populus x berolinensis]|uniref:Uncharacterized protein n=1 Tax=Populus alba x Populus x berolinensis TaxID=444605 RepID=A0AAD6PXB7_9ROSI|nr:hypothetical protein NC653_035463 [Populus alba x Populus x berolinensis]